MTRRTPRITRRLLACLISYLFLVACGGALDPRDGEAASERDTTAQTEAQTELGAVDSATPSPSTPVQHVPVAVEPEPVVEVPEVEVELPVAADAGAPAPAPEVEPAPEPVVGDAGAPAALPEPSRHVEREHYACLMAGVGALAVSSDGASLYCSWHGDWRLQLANGSFVCEGDASCESLNCRPYTLPYRVTSICEPMVDGAVTHSCTWEQGNCK